MHLEPYTWKLMHQVLAWKPDYCRDGMNCGCDKEQDNTTLHPIAFTRTCLLSTKWCYSNTGCEALGLDKFQHYCCASKVCIITDHKPLVAVISKDMAMLSEWLQCMVLHIHQYRVCIMYKPGPYLYITEWLSRNNHTEKRPGNDWHEYKYECNQYSSKYASMHIHRKHTCDNIQRPLPAEAEIIHNTWLATQKDELEHSIMHYCPIISQPAMINSIAMREKIIIIPFLLLKNPTAVAQQPHG